MGQQLGFGVALTALVLASASPSAAAGSFNGRWAFFPGDDAAAADPVRGMGTDAGCRKFLASAEYKPSAPQNLTISDGRWKTREKSSDVSGKVTLGPSAGGKTQALIEAKLDGRIVPTKATLTRDGRALTVVTRNAVNGAQVYHFCKTG